LHNLSIMDQILANKKDYINIFYSLIVQELYQPNQQLIIHPILVGDVCSELRKCLLLI